MGNEANEMKIRDYLLLGVAIIFGCYLRLRHIEANGLWLDEAFSVATSDPDNSFINVYKRTLSDVHPPFYQLLLWAFYKGFGYAEMTGRYLSVFFGTLLIPLMFYLGRQLLNNRAGLVCAWLSAVSFYLVTYSQETRSYSLLVFLVVLSFVVFIIAVRNPTTSNVTVYALVLAVLANTHYFGLLPIAAQVILFFLLNGWQALRKEVLLKFSIAGVFVLVTLSPAAFYIMGALERKEFWVPVPNDHFFVELFALFFGGLSLSIISSILILSGLVTLIKEKSMRVVLWVVVIWVVVCVMVPYLRSLYVQPVLTMRNLIVVLPALILLLGYGVSQLRDRVVFNSVVFVMFSFSMTPLFTDEKPVFTYENQLRPVSQMRDVIKNLIDHCSSCLIYSPDVIEAQGYAKILGSTLKFRSIDLMEKDIESSAKPLDFFIFTTRGTWEDDTSYMNRIGFYLVKGNQNGDSSSNEYRSNH
ncbi:glycosyltransferase family 39 protein [Pseudomonas monsensis]